MGASGETCGIVANALARAVRRGRHSSYVAWNDASRRTHADVLRALDRAVASLTPALGLRADPPADGCAIEKGRE